LVYSEVWNKVILGRFLWFLERGVIGMLESLLLSGNVILSIFYIMVDTKIWHEIVLWMTFWRFEGCLHHMSKATLSRVSVLD